MDVTKDRLFGGVYSYAMTPFNKNGDVDHGALTAYIESLVDAGVDGVTINASTTEVHYLSDSERKAVFETAFKAVKGRVVLNAGVGTHSTRQSLYFAEHAKEVGADRLICELPSFFKINFEEALKHYATIGDTIGLPLRIYNISAPTHNDFTPHQALQLANIDMVDSFKEATADPLRTRDVVNLVGDRLQIYCGFHYLLPEVIDFGAVGWEGGMHPAFAPLSVQLFRELIKDTQSEKSKELFNRLAPLYFFMKTYGVTQTVKAMDQWTDSNFGVPRPPQHALPKVAMANLHGILGRLGII